MFPARAQTITDGTGSLRLTGWCPHTVCYQPPGHCQSCTRNAHTTATNPRHPPTTVSLSLGTVVLSWTPGKAQASKRFQTSSTSRMLDVRERLRNATVAATRLGAGELVRTVCVPELPVGPGDARPQLAVVRRHRHVVVAARHFSHLLTPSSPLQLWVAWLRSEGSSVASCCQP